MNKINEFVKTFQLELDSKRKQDAHRRRFSVALKQAVVALMQEQVVDRKQMAALIGVSDWTINDWINKPLFKPATHTPPPVLAKQQPIHVQKEAVFTPVRLKAEDDRSTHQNTAQPCMVIHTPSGMVIRIPL